MTVEELIRELASYPAQATVCWGHCECATPQELGPNILTYHEREYADLSGTLKQNWILLIGASQDTF